MTPLFWVENMKSNLSTEIKPSQSPWDKNSSQMSTPFSLHFWFNSHKMLPMTSTSLYFHDFECQFSSLYIFDSLIYCFLAFLWLCLDHEWKRRSDDFLEEFFCLYILSENRLYLIPILSSISWHTLNLLNSNFKSLNRSLYQTYKLESSSVCLSTYTTLKN